MIKETDESISNIIKRISASYIFCYNKKYERCGHLFQERFKSEVVDSDEYFLTVLRYIHKNPIKAGIAEKLDNYKWSSYVEYVEDCNMIDTDLALQMLSVNKQQAIDIFKEFHDKRNNDVCLEYENKIRIPDQEIRKYVNELDIDNIENLKLILVSKRNDVLKRLKSIEGVTLRQLSRITGISKSAIDRV